MGLEQAVEAAPDLAIFLPEVTSLVGPRFAAVVPRSLITRRPGGWITIKNLLFLKSMLLY